MLKLAKTLAAISLPTIFFAYLTVMVNYNPKSESGEKTQHPGYFEQWFNEKKNDQGIIPAWVRQSWYNWDQKKRNVAIRNNSNPIDTVIELGPLAVGGRTRALWIDPRNEKIILAGGISGGMWRSENSGTSWKPINEHEVSLMPSCITHNPFNPNEIYYGTGESRANSAEVDGNGVFYSSDGGKSFSQLSSTINKAGFNAIWDISHSRTDSNTIYVGTHANGLFRTTDHGQSWKPVFVGGNKQVNNILCFPNGRVMMSMQSNQVYASDKNGDSGTYTAVKFPNMPGNGSYRRIQMGYCEKFSNVVYAIFEGFDFSATPVRFYKSSDFGKTWTERVAPVDIGASYQAYCLMLGVSPTDSNRVVCGGVNIATTSNGGNSWVEITTGHSDHHAYAFLPTTTNEFLVGTDGGVFKYRWNSISYIANLNNGYRVTQFYAGSFAPTGLIAISGAQDNGTHVASKPFVSRSFFGGDGAYCHIGLEDGSVAYVSYQNATPHRMDNFNPNAPSWPKSIADARFSSDGVDFINLYSMAPGDQSMLFYRTNRGLYRSTDAGNSWDKITTVIRAGIKAIGISNHLNPVVYFGGTSAQLYKIERAATTLSGKEVNFNNSVPTPVTNDNIKGITVHPNNPYIVYIALSNFNNQPRVWKVTGLDSVTNKPLWTNISGDLPLGLPVNMMAVDPKNPDRVFFAGTDFGLYYTTDSGKTWTKEYRIPNVSIHELKMRDDGQLFAFTHGRGMFALTLKDLQFNNTQKIHPQTHAITVYPQPANDILKIKGLENSNNVTFSILDLQGKCIAQDRLSSDAQISLKSIPAGIYLLQIKIDNRIVSYQRILVSENH